MRKGFTLVELLIYSVLFAIVSITLIYFLTFFFRINSRSASSSEVASQANFILQKIQNEIANASFLTVNNNGDDETDAALAQPYTHLVIKDKKETTGGASDSNSPVLMYKKGDNVVVKRGNQQETILNSVAVKVHNLFFSKISTPPGRDVVIVTLTLQHNTADPKGQLTREFILGVGKANAAVFDTALNPNANNAQDMGASSLKWKTLFLGGDINVDGKVVWTAGNAPNNSIASLNQGMVSINPPDIGANANWTTTKTISGVVTGDRVWVTAPSDLESGLVFVGAKITATDTLSITIRNVTGAIIADSATTLKNWSYFIIR